MPSISVVTPGTNRHALVPLTLLQKLTHQVGTEETGIKLSNLPHSRLVLERISQTHRRSRVLRADENVGQRVDEDTTTHCLVSETHGHAYSQTTPTVAR